MGAAWRQAPEGEQFERVLEMVREVKALGLEACATLGMLTPSQAARLKEAGLDAYNHNLDTSREYYSQIISTRTYDDRLETLRAARQAGITLCCGGILGMGESAEDRCRLLAELAALDPHPESVPINLLVPIKGTPLENAPKVDPAGLGSDHRRRAHPDAEVESAARGRPTESVSRSAVAGFLRRRKFHLHRRQAAHNSQLQRQPGRGGYRCGSRIGIPSDRRHCHHHA